MPKRMAFRSTSQLLLNPPSLSDCLKLRPKMEARAISRKKTQRPNADAYWRRRATSMPIQTGRKKTAVTRIGR